MLTAGDEFGRSQGGNNNAYCQDMPVDWAARDVALEDHVAALAAERAANLAAFTRFPEGGQWLSPEGQPMRPEQWESLATDGFTHVPPAGFPSLSVSRSERRILR